MGTGRASTFFDGKGPPPQTGQLVIAFDASGVSAGRFGERIAALCAMIEAQPGARLPGARRLTLREAARRDGIVVPQVMLKLLGA